MLEEANNFLACPDCKSTLELTSNEKKDIEIISGTLQCQNNSCKKIFHINNGIPNFLV
tara:strand:+ start:6622 stop:6795 length:174 start_codon:yes stop_codon:yes gene_type:complete